MMCPKKYAKAEKAANYSAKALSPATSITSRRKPTSAAPRCRRQNQAQAGIASAVALMHTGAPSLLSTITRTRRTMTVAHKNKTLATLLAALLGGVGAHRFYLYGSKDRRAWLYVLCLPFSIFAGFIAALVIGLTPDEKWDATHNAASGQSSDSGWLVILIVIATFGIGTGLLIATIARTFDLLYTGGAYG
jgi:hypothetical protein